MIMNSVGVLMKNLTIRKEEVNEEGEMHKEPQQTDDQDLIVTEIKMEIMASSSNFNNNHQQKSSDGGDEFHEEIQEIYKQR